MKILAISVGQPVAVQWDGREIMTSIYKSAISTPAQVRTNNIEGDRQADLTVHGGRDKAVYAYSHDTYSWWEKELNLKSLPFGSFGENLTTDHLDETKIFVGDIFEVGSCQLEAVQPRVPCFKLGIKFGDQGIIQTFNDFHRCGVYFRVKKEGVIQAGDSFKLIGSEKIKAPISELFQFIKDRGVTTKARAQELAQIQSLNEKWKNKFTQISQLPDGASLTKLR
jgi:MOSC domain-containing protein YiiM